MKLLLRRIYTNNRYTIGKLYANDEYVCDTIEDTDIMELNSMMSDAWIRNHKKIAQTAIPSGTFDITMNIVSPKFSKKDYYMKFCKGRLPRLLSVNGFDGILIHRGRTERDSAGCIIVGYNKVKGQVVNSQEAFEKLYKILDAANRKGEKITIEIQRCWKKV